MLLIKMFLLAISPLLLILGGIWLLPQVLSVDDLQPCSSPIATHEQCQPADAIVAISGGDTDARARTAIQLYQDGWAPKLILSGAALDKRGISNAGAMRQLALRAGVPDSAILIDEQAVDTAGNAQGLRPIVREYALKRIIVVTSPYHQRRASTEFTRALGDEVVVVSRPTYEDQYWPEDRWWSNPYGWYLAISEMTKLIYLQVTHR